MNNADQLLPRRRAKVQEIEFEDDHLIAVILDGKGVAVPVREICRGLGLDVELLHVETVGLKPPW